MSLPTVVVIVSIASMVSGHGRVMEPVSRASAWRKGFDTPKNYDDDGLNCGGMSQQWSANGGRCGICGDAYDLPTPRPHEIGGKYGEGVIVRAYNPGSIITTAVQLTASHRGFWEFKICPDPEENDQRCFNKYPLELEDGGTKFYPTEGAKLYEVNFRLPQGLTCEHCVLQWRYTAGNNWGDCMNGTQGMGCGHQEQFGACSDIVIGNGENDLFNNDLYSEQAAVNFVPVLKMPELSKGWVMDINNNVEGDGLDEVVFDNFDVDDKVVAHDINKDDLPTVMSADVYKEIDIDVKNSKAKDMNKVQIVDQALDNLLYN